MNRQEKQDLVEKLHQQFKEAALVVVAHQTGLTAGETMDLRTNAHKNDVFLKVSPNRLTRLALKGTPFEYLADHFSGPTTVAFSSDPVAAAKMTVTFANGNEKFSVVAGGMPDKELKKAEIEALSKLPSLDELRGKLIGVLQAPATKVACVVKAPAGKLARVFGAYGATS